MIGIFMRNKNKFDKFIKDNYKNQCNMDDKECQRNIEKLIDYIIDPQDHFIMLWNDLLHDNIKNHNTYGLLDSYNANKVIKVVLSDKIIRKTVKGLSDEDVLGDFHRLTDNKEVEIDKGLLKEIKELENSAEKKSDDTHECKENEDVCDRNWWGRDSINKTIARDLKNRTLEYVLLGNYNHKSKTITIYYNAIYEDCENKRNFDLYVMKFKSIWIHELFYAVYFDLRDEEGKKEFINNNMKFIRHLREITIESLAARFQIEYILQSNDQHMAQNVLNSCQLRSIEMWPCAGTPYIEKKNFAKWFIASLDSCENVGKAIYYLANKDNIDSIC